jgi:hypothetical protein
MSRVIRRRGRDVAVIVESPRPAIIFVDASHVTDPRIRQMRAERLRLMAEEHRSN